MGFDTIGIKLVLHDKTQSILPVFLFPLLWLTASTHKWSEHFLPKSDPHIHTLLFPPLDVGEQNNQQNTNLVSISSRLFLLSSSSNKT